ncbi:hypothetical protein R83H12_00599 [Fibrobacteria bacterium R8-3-H12]
MKSANSTLKTAIKIKPRGSRNFAPCLSYMRPARGEIMQHKAIAGNSVSEAVSDETPRTLCIKIGMIIFIANNVTSESILIITPILKGFTESGTRSISGELSFLWRLANIAKNTMPAKAAAAATFLLPENTVAIPYSIPVNAKQTRATERASSFGRVSFATLCKSNAPTKNKTQESPANTHSKICQSKKFNRPPAATTLNEGPSVVIAPIKPM